jgi:hypothetical protein
MARALIDATPPFRASEFPVSKELTMPARVLAVLPVLVMLSFGSGVAAQQIGAPETFVANLQAVGGQGGAAAATIQIDISRYTPEADRTAVEGALKQGGYPAFVTALRKAPEVGTVSFADRKWAIRWAREQASGQYSRRIVIVTDQPIFFVGGGRIDAKPREGYEVAVLELEVDNAGLGKGTMTAAARVKPGDAEGVKIEDYADKPIKLVSVSRKLK